MRPRGSSEEESDDVAIRRELRPGDLGAIVGLHGRLYAGEYGLDETFEATVAASVARCVGRGWPRSGGVWLVDLPGEATALGGSLALTDEGGADAQLRWFVLDPLLRGRGLGRRLVAQLMATARERGYERVRLETFSELEAAARIYAEHGFELTGSDVGPRWGRERLDYRSYAARLAVPSATAGR